MNDEKTCVFALSDSGQEVWRAMLDGVIIPATWNSKGAALAGLEVERRRKNKTK